MTTPKTETGAGSPSPSTPLLAGQSDEFNEALYDEVCRLRCYDQQRGFNAMILMAADEIVKLRRRVEELSTANAGSERT